MSMSLVMVGEPQSRPATPPMTMNRTPCSWSIRSAANGSYATSGNPAGGLEAEKQRGFVDQGLKPLGWRHGEEDTDPGPVYAPPCSRGRPQTFPAALQEP